MSYKVILELWKRQPGKFFCLSTKSGAGKWKDHFFAPEDFGTIRQFILDNDEKDIYFCPHGFNRRVRQKEEAVIPNVLWADLDFVDPRKCLIKPTIAIESSPGRFVGLWEIKNGQMTESLNRRLTYFLGADHGGWDLTQVLRLPGTKNYKYKTQPKVRLLWDDGKLVTIKKLESILPPDEEEDEGNKISAAEVFEKYQGKLPRWVRRELLNKKVVGRSDRSEMLWKLENACVEAGMTLDEAFAVIKRSGWNKFAGRRNEDTQLRRELSKVVENQFKEKPQGADKRHMKSDEEESRDEKRVYGAIQFEILADIEREEMDYIWEPYLARGVVTILEGDPGLGKSYVAQMVSGSIASGRRIKSPRLGSKKVRGTVFYFDMENSASTVTKPRLEDNGFEDLTNYFVIQQPFSIDDDDTMDLIYDKFEEHKPALVVFDTLNTYIGRADTHKASETAQAFGMFMQIAKDFNCAVLVLRHLTKGGGSAMYRGQGSIGFAGLARCVLSVGVDPEDTDTRVIAVTKMNYAKAPQALSFRIEEKSKGKGRSEFIWGDFVNLTSQEVLDAASEKRAEGKVGDSMQEAMEFLESTINGTAVEVDRLYRMGEKRSISKKMIDRAAARMSVIKKMKKGVESWGMKKEKEPE